MTTLHRCPKLGEFSEKIVVDNSGCIMYTNIVDEISQSNLDRFGQIWAKKLKKILTKVD